ncbi:LCP family protein [Marinilactibacillus kalidii]|uniref:LCP family protein n=1 Tax=Marinilactibacillus kalidii TaxID=2820274 RepID=UPI001FC9AA0E|nr:LCP family protein [Marinilactibacillus kalidii]
MSKNKSSRAHARRSTKSKKKSQIVILAILIPLFTIVLITMAYLAKFYATTENAIESSYHEIDRATPVESVDPIEEPVSFLIMGVDNDDADTRSLGSARADSIIYATVNPITREMNMVSIPRDTYLPIIKNNQFVRNDRINAAYAVGEESTMIETVENWLDVPIHYYATFNFDAFLEIIDALDGIDMDVPITFSEQDSSGKLGTIRLEEGFQTLNGEEALALARTRKIDNDVERGHRQQLVIQAIMKKALNLGSIPKYTSIVETVGANMRTNMRMNDMTALAQTGLDKEFTIESHVFEWSSFTERGMDLVKIDPTSFSNIQMDLKNSLDKNQTSTQSLTEETNDETTSNTINSDKESNTISPKTSDSQ